MSGGQEGGALAPPSLPKTFTMTVFWEDLPVAVYRDVVAFEPQVNAYLATTQSFRRIVIPFGKVVKIEVNPDE